MAKIDIVLEKVHEIREDQIQTNTDVKWIKKALEGNGKQGLIEETHNKLPHYVECYNCEGIGLVDPRV